MSATPAPSTTVPRRSDSQRVELPCGECGLIYDVSARYAREVRRGVYPARCPSCKSRRTRQRPTDTDRRWWLERFNDEELVRIVEAFFGSSDGGVRLAAWRAKLC